MTNSSSLDQRIKRNEMMRVTADTTKPHNVVEEDKTYTKDLLGGRQGSQEGEQKILGVRWNYIQDWLVLAFPPNFMTHWDMCPQSLFSLRYSSKNYV